jgi:16S rRNA C967 or C1407 C5-methylase (RsmB/RsmF family)
MKLKELRSFANLQKKLFSTAVQLVKSPGGVIVYSTCTFTLDENEGLVAWALEKFPQLELVAATPLLGQPCIQVEIFGAYGVLFSTF